MLSSYASGAQSQRHDRFGMDASRCQPDNSMNSGLEKKVIDLTQLIKGTQCLVDEIQQSHNRGLGLLKCRIDRLEVSHRNFVENWEINMRKIITEQLKSHESQYRHIESRMMTGLTKGLKEFQSARSSMENSRACFQGTIEEICMQTGNHLEELEERLSEFEDNVVDSINKISHQSGLYLLDADTIKRKLECVETTVAKMSGDKEVPMPQEQNVLHEPRLKNSHLRPQRRHTRRYKVQIAAPQTERASYRDMDLILARMPKNDVRKNNLTHNSVDESLQDKVGLRFEESFLSVQEKLNCMHGTFDDVKETLGCMKDSIPLTQEGKSCKDNLLQSPCSKMPRDQSPLDVDGTFNRSKVHEMKSSIRVDETDIDQNIGSGPCQTCRENCRMEMKSGMNENARGCLWMSEAQSHLHREYFQVGSSQRDAGGGKQRLDEKQERRLVTQKSGDGSGQAVRNEHADHCLIRGNLVLPMHAARVLIPEEREMPVKESRKGSLPGFHNKGKPTKPEFDLEQPNSEWRRGGKLLRLYSELRELENQTS